jgi:hypothetical protein
MKKYYIITALLMLWSGGLIAQGIYNNGASIVVNSGASLNITGSNGNFRNETSVTDGSVILNGRLQLTGNYVNNALNADVISAGSTGEVVFNGTLHQQISGNSTVVTGFINLTVNNPAGLGLLKDVGISGILGLTVGLVDLGSANLLLKPTATVTGTPSVSNMIVATGTGELRRGYSTTGIFTFPVGDNTATPEYSPVTLDLTSGTFSPGAFIGLNLSNSKYNDPGITGSWINRYWNLSQTGVSGFSVNAVFQYLAADVSGVETDIYCSRISPAPPSVFDPANTTLHQLSATGLTSLGTFTGTLGYKTVNIKAFLEGLYTGNSLMAQCQGNNGNQFPGTTADQISIELHSATAGQYATILYTALNVNLDVNGSAVVNVPALYNGSYYLTIRSRNGIETVSAAPVSFAGGTVSYDFSTAATQAFGANLKNINGVFVLYSGDVNQDGIIDVSDMIPISNLSAQATTGYLPEDVNGDGLIDVSDMVIAANNSSQAISSLTP